MSCLSYTLCAQSITNYTTDEGLPSDVINCLAIDGSGNLWIGTSSGVSIMDQENWTTLNQAQGTGLVDDNITTVHVSDYTGLWVGTDFGICNWNTIEWTCYDQTNGLENIRINALTSNENGLYIAHKDGFSWLDNAGIIINYGTDIGLPFGGVTSIELVNDNMVLGLGLGGVAFYNILDEAIFIIDQDEGLINNRVKGLHIDFINEEVLIATDGGLSVFNEADTELINYSSVFELPPPHTLNQLVDVDKDSEGRIWTGVFIDYLVNVGGISYQSGEDWISIDVDDGLVSPVVNQIAIDSLDCVWVATGGGLSKVCLDGSSIKNLVDSDYNMSLFPNPVFDILTLNLDQSRRGNISIYNSTMSKVKSERAVTINGSHKLNVSDLISGIYFLEFNGYVSKFIKS